MVGSLFAAHSQHKMEKHILRQVTKEGTVPHAPLRATIASTTICLFGSLLLGPTIAMAEYNVSAALQAYDSADSTNRKTWELIFGNAANGINVANTVLFFRKQEPFYCPPDDFAPSGPQVIEMLRELATSKPKLATVPYGFAILLALQGKYPCG
jgi:hypothetical protein